MQLKQTTYLRISLVSYQSKSLMRFCIVFYYRLAFFADFNSANWLIICLFLAAFYLYAFLTASPLAVL